jgi:hypothetical protein
MDNVRITAVKSLFDLIHVYGLGAFEDCADTSSGKDEEGNENDNSRDLLEDTSVESESETSKTEEESTKGEHSESSWSKTASSLISILSSMLDSEVKRINTVRKSYKKHL